VFFDVKFEDGKEVKQVSYLIDEIIDRNVSDRFSGELIHFGSEKYPDWKAVVDHLKKVLE